MKVVWEASCLFSLRSGIASSLLSFARAGTVLYLLQQNVEQASAVCTQLCAGGTGEGCACRMDVRITSGITVGCSWSGVRGDVSLVVCY